MQKRDITPEISNIVKLLNGKKPKKVLFVCLGNICRSPAAQGVLQHIVDTHVASADWHIDSAGTYGGHAGDMPDRRMRIHAQRRGYNLTPVSFTQLRAPEKGRKIVFRLLLVKKKKYQYTNNAYQVSKCHLDVRM